MFRENSKDFKKKKKGKNNQIQKNPKQIHKSKTKPNKQETKLRI